MITISFDKPMGVFIWATLGLFGVKHKCQACHKHIKPSTLGAAQRIGKGRMGLWHAALPCMIHFKNREIDIINSGGTAENAKTRH